MRIYHFKMTALNSKLSISLGISVIVVYCLYWFYHVSSNGSIGTRNNRKEDWKTGGDFSPTEITQRAYVSRGRTTLIDKFIRFNFTSRKYGDSSRFRASENEENSATEGIEVIHKHGINIGNATASKHEVDEDFPSRADIFRSSYRGKLIPSRRFEKVKKKQSLLERLLNTLKPKAKNSSALVMRHSNTRKRFPDGMKDASTRDFVEHPHVAFKHVLNNTHFTSNYSRNGTQISSKNISYPIPRRSELGNYRFHQKGHILDQHKSINPKAKMLSSLLNNERVKYSEGFLNDSTFYREVRPVNIDFKHSILLLHASVFTSTVWVNIGTMEVLGESGHHTVAIDLPGYGRSLNATIPYTSDEIIVYMINLFQTFDFIQPVVASPSMSGEYLMPLLMAHPNLLSGIIALSPTHSSDYSTRSYEEMSVPALVLLGKEDRTMLNWASLDNLEHLKNKRIFAIENATKECYVDQPATFHKLVLKFLDGLQSNHETDDFVF